MTIVRKRQSGMSLVEVLAGLAIVSVMVLGTVTVMSNAHNLTRMTSSKEFATQKAISMIEELKSLVQTNTGSTIVTLDDYDDGVKNNMVLTTIGEKNKSPLVPPLPDDIMSGNVLLAGPDTWQYERLITVRKIKGQSNDVRLVNVKVYENLPRGGQLLLAEVSSVIRTLAATMPPTQVYDVYCLAIENVPGWWVYMSNVVPFVKSAISDLQARNPGLIFRTHWITSLAYGRDLLYKPYINNAVDSNADIDSVYFYPGKMPQSCISAGNCGDDYYYPSFFFRGRVSIDGNDTNGYDPQNNPNPYAIADQYNNAMRYYDEKKLYDDRKKAAALQDPPATEEMTWRLLMDDMYMNPQNYTNALIINLHGELMPFPPVRNYSDAAKSPATAGLLNVRAVIHPEQLVYASGSPVTLRVYTYTDPPSATAIMPVPLTVRISGLTSWIPTSTSVQVIHGGVDNDGTGGIDAYDAAPVPAPAYPVAGKPNQMAWTWSLDGVTGDTILKLYGSPLKTPIESSGRGLAVEDRLYGLDYIPSPVEDLTTGAVQFSTDLTSTSVRPKNTARWMIRIPAAAIPVNGTVLTVDTRIGDQETSGYLYPAANDPENRSRTYAWCGPNTYVFGNATTPPKLPLTERFQVIGDPRHCPYADLKRPNVFNPPQFPPAAIVGPPAIAAGAYESALGMGFNRYFDDMEDSDPNRGLSPVRNRGYSAEVTSSRPEPFTITTGGSGNNIFSVRTEAGVTVNVALPGGNLTALQVAQTLNANATFALYATADPPNGTLVPVFNRVRITSKGRAGSSVQFLTGTANNCGAALGFTNGVNTTAAWPGWVYSVGAQQYGINNNGNLSDAGWDTGAGSLEIDVHRLFQMLRSTLTRSNAIWTTMTGFSYYYIGIGNEIGYDSANGFPNSVPVSTKPFTGSGGSLYENSITGTVKYIRESLPAPVAPAPDTRFWAKPWMGELYPDSVYASWLASGNIPTGSGANKFVRDNRAKFPVFTSTNLTDAVRRTKEMGSTTFFWNGNANSTFHHTYHDGDQAAIAPPGKDIADNYSLPVPDTIDNARPFDVNVDNTGYNPENFLEPASYPNAYVARVLNTYYTHGGAPVQGSALVALTDPSNNPAFIAVNGLSPTGVAGTTFIAKWSFLTLIQSYLNGGLYTDASAAPTANHIRQLPRVVITDPNENTDLKQKSSITVAWDTTFRRWDGLTYTTDPKYANWTETLTMKYAVIYSPSNGVADKDPTHKNPTGWFYIQDNSVANTGVKPDAAHEISLNVSAVKTSASATWNTPSATFPQGNYLIRVEGYREGYPLHYSFHQYRAFFQR
ncbi:MAG TPA: type II secretion system protein [Thermoanaerobaculia bacterium]|nr:type II secretion system protein [Thermoanaerobaculia bacterium]